MTIPRSRLATVVLVIAAGTALYQTWQASLLRNQIRLLQQQTTAQAEQIQQLVREREESARQLANSRQENERLNRNATELLKLRAEVARLKRNPPIPAPPDAEKNLNRSIGQIESWDEAPLNEQQRKTLREMSEQVKTGNSVADLNRLKDSLKRWDELFLTPAPPELKPVFFVLKHRVQARVAELEQEQSEAATQADTN